MGLRRERHGIACGRTAAPDYRCETPTWMAGPGGRPLGGIRARLGDRRMRGPERLTRRELLAGAVMSAGGIGAAVSAAAGTRFRRAGAGKETKMEKFWVFVGTSGSKSKGV